MPKNIDRKVKNLILADYLKGETLKEIRRKYNISYPTVYNYIGETRRYKKRNLEEKFENNEKLEPKKNPTEEEVIKEIENSGLFKKMSKQEKDFYTSYLILTLRHPNEEDLGLIKEILSYATPAQAKSILIYRASNYPDKVSLQSIKTIVERMNLRSKTKGGDEKKIIYKQTDERKTIAVDDVKKILKKQGG